MILKQARPSSRERGAPHPLNRVEGIGDLVAFDKDPVGIERGCFLQRVDQGGAV